MPPAALEAEVGGLEVEASSLFCFSWGCFGCIYVILQGEAEWSQRTDGVHLSFGDLQALGGQAQRRVI